MKHILITILIFSSFSSFSQQKTDTIILNKNVETIYRSPTETLLLVRDTSFALPTKYRIKEAFFNSLISYYSEDSIRKTVIDSLRPELLSFEFNNKNEIIPYIISKGLLETDTIYSSLLEKNIEKNTFKNDVLKVQQTLFRVFLNNGLYEKYRKTKDLLNNSVYLNQDSIINDAINRSLHKNDTIYLQLLQRNIISYSDSLDIIIKQSNFSIMPKLIKQNSVLALKDSVLLSFQFSKGQDSILLIYNNKNLLIIKKDDSLFATVLKYMKNNLLVSAIILGVLLLGGLLFGFKKKMANYFKYRKEMQNAKSISEEETQNLVNRLVHYKNASKFCPRKKKAKQGISETKNLIFDDLINQAGKKLDNQVNDRKKLYQQALTYKLYEETCISKINEIDKKLQTDIENDFDQLYKEFINIINDYYGIKKEIDEKQKRTIKEYVDKIKEKENILNYQEKETFIKKLYNSELTQNEYILKKIKMSSSYFQFFEETNKTIDLSEKLKTLDLKDNFEINFEECQNLIKEIKLQPIQHNLMSSLSSFENETLTKIGIDFIKNYNNNIIKSLYLSISNDKYKQDISIILYEFSKNKIAKTIFKYSEDVKIQIEQFKNNREIMQVYLLSLTNKAFDNKFDEIKTRNSLKEDALNNYELQKWEVAYDAFLKMENRNEECNRKYEECKLEIIKKAENFISEIVLLEQYGDINVTKINAFIEQREKYNFIDYNYIIDIYKLSEIKNIDDNDMFQEFFKNDFINSVILKTVNLFNEMGKMNEKQFNNLKNQSKLVFAHKIFKSLKVYDKLDAQIKSISNN